MIFRTLWILCILAVASVTAGVQLDRQARFNPTFVASVPEPFRAFSQRHVTVEALRDGNKALALTEARELVARRPMPAEHLRLLSLAEFEAGSAEQSVYSIQLAARRGWRDRSSQETMLNLAVAAGDQTEAARRFAALFARGGLEELELRAFAQKVFGPGSGPARTEFANILSEADRWLRVYLRQGPGVFPTDAFIDITKQAKDAGASFQCENAERTVERLRRMDRAASDALSATFGDCR